jgi:ferritin
MENKETLEEFAKQEATKQYLEGTFGNLILRKSIEKGAKWQMDKQNEFTLGFLHWYNTSQECETYLRRNYPKNITMNGEHYKKVLEINKELLEMYKNTLPR